MKKTALFLLMAFLFTESFSQSTQVIHLWMDKVPGEDSAKHPAQLYPDTSGNVIRFTDITDPVISVYRSNTVSTTNAGIIICPGGGNKYLAMNLEGTEVALWLNKIGVTAFLLQYRVPDKQKASLQDIQRAIRLVRNNAAEWGIDTDKIGVMGFSAGGNLAARAATNFNNKTYIPVDNMDSISCRPDFALLIYPGPLSRGPDHKLIPQLPVEKDDPPMFLFVTNDDPIGLPLSLAYALHEAKVPTELHVYPKGGHGYGLRKGNPAAEAWPPLAATWMKNILKNKSNLPVGQGK
ncbi:MAG: alpha/beta hydrolase [Ginsengibacter sp.]